VSALSLDGLDQAEVLSEHEDHYDDLVVGKYVVVEGKKRPEMVVVMVLRWRV
jgi:hypothetical protein